MKKTTPTASKKVATQKKVASVVTSTPEKKEEAKKTYHFRLEMNDKVFECDTDDLRETILSYKPVSVKTKLLFTLTKGELSCVKQVFVQKARMIFGNKVYLTAFIKQLIFK